MHYMLFVTFFPQLIAGPIVHHKDVLPQFIRKDTFTPRAENFAVGTTIFFIGLFKKVVLADSVAPFANTVFNSALAGGSIGFADAWAGAFAYSFQIYFDFSGYSDMAIGLARMVGIRLPLNFDSPYKSTGIIDLWKRWHMTLSRFLRDYLYFPLGGNRLGNRRRYVNLMIVMLLGGLWHGAGWTFVIWGGLHGIYLGFNHAWRAWRGDKRRDTLFARSASTIVTYIAIVVAWVFFRAESFPAAWSIIVSMASVGTVLDPAQLLGSFSLGRELLLWLVVMSPIVWFLPNTQQIMQQYKPALKTYPGEIKQVGFPFMQWQPKVSWAIAIGGSAVISILYMSRINEFIYFQF